MIYRLALIASCALVAASLVRSQETQPPRAALRMATPDQLQAELRSVPCKNEDRAKAVIALFHRMGAASQDVAIEQTKGTQNIVVRKPGASPETVIVGAHYDKTPDGCGAVDNWTGVVTVAHMYAALKDRPLKKTVWFAAFGKEESGLIGSSGMAGNIPKKDVAQYCAMVNIDSLGLQPPQAMANRSAPKLVDFAAAHAADMSIPFSRLIIPDGDADSSSFNDRKIPAITISGLPANWGKILHTPADQVELVNAQSLFTSYYFALTLVAKLDDQSCQLFR